MWHYILETEDYYASLAISPDPEDFDDSDMCFSMGATPTDEQGAMFAEALNVHEATGLTPAQLQSRVAELEGALREAVACGELGNVPQDADLWGALEKVLAK